MSFINEMEGRPEINKCRSAMAELSQFRSQKTAGEMIRISAPSPSFRTVQSIIVSAPPSQTDVKQINSNANICNNSTRMIRRPVEPQVIEIGGHQAMEHQASSAEVLKSGEAGDLHCDSYVEVDMKSQLNNETVKPEQGGRNSEESGSGDDVGKDNYYWTPKSVEDLIDLYMEYKDGILNSAKPKIYFFNKIAQDLSGKYPSLRDRGTVVQSKWNKLHNSFKLAEKKKLSTGQSGVINFQHYDLMKAALAGDPRHTPPVTASAGVADFFKVNRTAGTEEAEEDDKLTLKSNELTEETLPKSKNASTSKRDIPPPRKRVRTSAKEAAVEALKGIGSQVESVAQGFTASNEIQKERNELLRQLILGRGGKE